MSRGPAWLRYARFWRRDVRAEVDDEIAFHIEGVVEELRATGISDADARRAALRRFGDVERVATSMQSLATMNEVTAGRAEWLNGLVQDVRYAARSLRRTPIATVAIIGTLALGLGTTAAMFALLDQLFWRAPAGVAHTDDLRRVWTGTFERWDGARHVRPTITYRRVQRLREVLPAGGQLGLYVADSAVRVGDGNTRARLSLADAALFQTLGVRPLAGRFFDASEDLVREPSLVAVVSERFYRTRLDADPSVIGKPLTLDGRAYVVIGVAGAAFTGVDLQATDVWVPLGNYRDDPRLRGPGVAPWWERPAGGVLRAVARLPASVNDSAVAASASRRIRELERQEIRRGGDTTVTFSFAPLAGLRGPGETRQEVRIAERLGALALIVLLVACANVTNLMLARAVQRNREVAVRVALGASRARLMRLSTVESAIIGVAVGLATGIVAWWAGGVLRVFLLPDIAWAHSTMHWRVALFSMATAFVASWLTAIVPALIAARTDAAALIKSGGRTQTSPRSVLRFALTAAQLGLSLALLVAAGSFVASLRRIHALDLGMDVERTMVGSVKFDDRASAPTGEVVADRLSEIRERLRAMPGVEAAALSLTRPMDGSWAFFGYFSGTDSLQSVKNSADWPAAFIVTSDYFRATGMRMVRGSVFNANADASAAPEIVVNESMAKLLWPAEDAIGRCIRLEKRTNPCSIVVGVVRDARREKLLEPAKPQYFMPAEYWRAKGWTASAIVLRIDPARREPVEHALRDALASALPNGTPLVEMLETSLSPQLRPWRLGANLFAAIGGIALVVALIGVYANLAYQVAQRMRDFGVRIALGASRRDVVRGVLVRALRPVVVGTVAGLALSIATGRFISTLLYDVSPSDPRILLGVAAVLVVVSMVASIVPAWRASSVDAVTALRAD